MYQITTDAFGSYTRHTLESKSLGHGFSVVPEAGANVLDIWFEEQSVLDGFATPEELAGGHWGKSTLLFPFPNRLLDGKFTYEGVTYEWPINNAATGNAIHGFIRSEAFTVESTQVSGQGCSITLAVDYDGRHAFYPFPFKMEVTYRLGSDRSFGVSVRVENKANTHLPFGFGWHPYFRLVPQAADHSLQLVPGPRVEIDDRMIPTGKLLEQTDFQELTAIGDTFIDNCFKAEPEQYEVCLAGGERKLVFKANKRDWPYFQVFTPPHRTSVALEPMTCNVNVLNSGDGLIKLAPNAVWEAGFEFVIG
jgi:aldose 1-epimerase